MIDHIMVFVGPVCHMRYEDGIGLDKGLFNMIIMRAFTSFSQMRDQWRVHAPHCVGQSNVILLH